MSRIDICPENIHIIAFPYPAKGHINPLLHFCNLLGSKGFKITFITTASTSSKLVTKSNNINFESIPDGVEEEEDDVKWEVYFNNFKTSASKNMAELIHKHKESSNEYPPKMVIYDAFMPWMLDVAKAFGLRTASFFPQNCSVCAVYYHMLHGTINYYLPRLERKDLPGFDFFKDQNQTVANLHFDIFSNIDGVDYLLFNTFDALETEVANWMANKWRIFTIGPTIPRMLLDKQEEEEEGKSVRSYLFETNTEVCLKWLDKREKNSVIYVSFGSVASLTEEQMEEVSQALILSNYYFLWVVREEEEIKLPKYFKFENLEKGMIIKWCPQFDVLNHKAIACFMTHCGWNSTLEALCCGVPIIGMPQFVDQTTNAKFIEDVWESGVGVNIKVNKDDEKNGIVKREEIESCIRKVIESERGKEMKRNAIKWKELAKEAVSEGGSSHQNIQEFVSRILLD